MSKGYIKLYRSEADIPQLWESARLFSTYQKLKVLADRADWAVTMPVRQLAKQMSMSVTTLKKTTKELAQIGLIRAENTADGVSRLVLIFADNEPDLARLNVGALTAAQTTRKTVPAVLNFSTTPALKFDTTKAAIVSNFDTTPVSNFDTPLYGIQEVTTNKKTTTPYNPPTKNGQPIKQVQSGALFDVVQTEQASGFMDCFAAFWRAYPNKKSKQRAIKRWKKGNYNLAEILPVLEKQKRLRNWVKADGQYVPRADAYLNQKRWEDELPTSEEAYILDFKTPKTERERVLHDWIEATNPELLKNDNQKINSVFEFDRIYFEKLVAFCGGNLQTTFNVMRHGWRLGCTTLRAISDRAASYLDDIKSQEYKK